MAQGPRRRLPPARRLRRARPLPRRPNGARWCAFLGTAAEYAEPPPVLAERSSATPTTLRSRLTALAEPVAGPAAAELAESLLLVVSGDLAMRLRAAGPSDTSVARRIAEAIVHRMGIS